MFLTFHCLYQANLLQSNLALHSCSDVQPKLMLKCYTEAENKCKCNRREHGRAFCQNAHQSSSAAKLTALCTCTENWRIWDTRSLVIALSISSKKFKRVIKKEENKTKYTTKETLSKLNLNTQARKKFVLWKVSRFWLSQTVIAGSTQTFLCYYWTLSEQTIFHFAFLF